MTPQLMHPKAVDDLDPGEHRPSSHRTVAEMRTAIAAALFENQRDLDIRFLWTQGAITYFRVNRWAAGDNDGPRIQRSAFIRVTRGQHGYDVREQRPCAAWR